MGQTPAPQTSPVPRRMVLPAGTRQRQDGWHYLPSKVWSGFLPLDSAAITSWHQAHLPAFQGNFPKAHWHAEVPTGRLREPATTRGGTAGPSGRSKPQQEWSLIAVRGCCVWEGRGQLPQEHRRAHSYHCLQGPGMSSYSCVLKGLVLLKTTTGKCIFLTYSSTNSRKHGSAEDESALPALPCQQHRLTANCPLPPASSSLKSR